MKTAIVFLFIFAGPLFGAENVFVNYGSVRLNHVQHQRTSRSSCNACHPKIRSKLVRGKTVAHKICGRCHEYDEQDKHTCNKCHEGIDTTHEAKIKVVENVNGQTSN